MKYYVIQAPAPGADPFYSAASVVFTTEVLREAKSFAYNEALHGKGRHDVEMRETVWTTHTIDGKLVERGCE